MKARLQPMTPDDVFAVRAKLGLTQVHFAALVGVDPITVSRWERGVTGVSLAYTTLIKHVVGEQKRSGR